MPERLHDAPPEALDIVRISRRIFSFLYLLLLCVGLALGQTAEVTHNVNLRADPSTNNPPIRLLTPPERVELLEPGKSNSYYHVKNFRG
jgi:hypothetical protein